MKTEIVKMSLRRGTYQLLALRQAAWPAVVGLAMCARDSDCAPLELSSSQRLTRPPAPTNCSHRARPAATMPPRCAIESRAKSASRPRAPQNRWRATHNLLPLSHTHARASFHLQLQALRNEDDYSKFASDTDRAHVNVSFSGGAERVCVCVFAMASAKLHRAVFCSA